MRLRRGPLSSSSAWRRFLPLQMLGSFKIDRNKTGTAIGWKNHPRVSRGDFFCWSPISYGFVSSVSMFCDDVVVDVSCGVMGYGIQT